MPTAPSRSPQAPIDPLSTTTELHAPLSAAQVEILSEIQRFLLAVVSGPLSLQAARRGYDRLEHQLGWGLWLRAAGVARPFEQRLPTSPGGRLALMRQGGRARYRDQWRPIILKGIQTHLPPASSAALSTLFVKAEAGEGAILKALGDLQTVLSSGGQGVAALRHDLQRQGLSVARLRWLRRIFSPDAEALVAELDGLHAQLRAFDALVAWWASWREVGAPRPTSPRRVTNHNATEIT